MPATPDTVDWGSKLDMLERRFRDFNTSSLGNNIKTAAQAGDETWSWTNVQRHDFTDIQMQAIQRLIKDTV